jgi:hyperosmotically inducible protein
MNRLTAIAAILLFASAVAGCQTLTGRTAREYIDDKWALHETKGRIAAQSLRTLTAVNVDVNRGTVYLMGTVTTPEQKVLAEQIARDVEGVHHVVNHLEVESSSPSASPSSGAPSR